MNTTVNPGGLGKHLVIELMGCCPEKLNDPAFLQETMENAARNAGATVMSSHFHTFEPQGVTGVVVLSESHISIHAWPELGYAAADVFTCGEHVRPSIAASKLHLALEAETSNMVQIIRGVGPEFPLLPDKIL